MRAVFRHGALRLFAAALLFLIPSAAQAQTGRISGTVRDADGTAVSGAQIVLVGSRLGALTNADGAYRIANVDPGTYTLRVVHMAYREASQEVTVSAGQEVRVDVTLTQAPVQLGEVVVSASRRPERITDAPATITRIDADAIANSVGNSFSGVLKNVKGLDYIQIGMTTAAVNARGFNSSFNNRMLMMEDGRIAVLPENGLPVGQFTAIPKLDLAGVEVLVGPGAALYGPDASNGVLTLQSKDPKEYPGTSFEVAGGNRSYIDVQGRQANVFGDWGFKVAGEWQRANDWSNTLTYNIATGGTTKPVPEDQMGENSIDWTSQVARGEGALIRYFENGAKLTFHAGASLSDGVGQTNVGRNQLKNWLYDDQQITFSHPHWYLNVYRTQSKSGDSFALNRYADAYAKYPNLSPDSLRMLSDWPSNGQLYAAEVQNNFMIPQLADTRLTWGVQYRHDIVSSDRQWLTDALTGESLKIDQTGVYAQTETPVGSKLSLVLAARYDDHQDYDAQFSPKVGLVFKPTEDDALRVTYNRAFKSPSTLQTHFFIPEFVSFVGVYGNTEGFTVKDQAGNVVKTYDPLVPEENQTVELGYRGVLGDRLWIDATGYYAWYQNFLGSLKTINNPYATTGAPTLAYDGSGQLITGATPLGTAPEIVLTYWNLGKANIYGTDVGLRFIASPKVTLSGTTSWMNITNVESTDVEATALNSPTLKWTAGADFVGIGAPGLLGGFTTRHVTGYHFQSGINNGKIGTYTTFDVNLGYRLPAIGSTVNLQVVNLFTCRSDAQLTAVGDVGGSTCGFDKKHSEMINMPGLGTMVFLGVRYNR